jgi:hypothetical protein
MSDGFASPSTATGIQWKDLKGSLLLVKVHGIEAAIKTVHGDTPAVRADVIVLDGDQAETTYNDTLIFPKLLQSQVKGQVGGMVLGRLGQGVAKPGQSAPWTLDDATEADKGVARAYLAKTVSPPF